MTDEIRVLDKHLAKKYIIKSRIVSLLDVLILFTLIISCITGNGQIYYLAMLILVNIWKIITIANHIRKISNDDFFVVKSAIVGEKIIEGEDSNSYYKYFKYNCTSGYIQQPVSKKIFDRYKNGDCFYLIFFKDNKKKQRPSKYIFACDLYAIDSEMKVGYTDCSHWNYVESMQVKESETGTFIPYAERMQSVSEEQKEKILEVGNKVSLLGKGMLISGIILFVLFIAFIATLSNTVLMITIISGAVFFGCLFKIISVTKNAPEYDGVIYYGLKAELDKKKRVEEEKEKASTICDESDNFQRDFYDKKHERRITEAFLKFRKIPAVIMGLFFLALTVDLVCEGIDGKNLYLFLTFSSITAISLLMIVTKIRLLSLMLVSCFFLIISAEAFFADKNAVTGIVLIIFSLIPALPVLIVNATKKHR